MDKQHKEEEEDHHKTCHTHHHHEEEEEACPHCGHHHHNNHNEHCCCEHNHDAEHSHGDEYGIHTWVFYSRRPLDLGNFDHFVARHWPKSIIRAKGMCYFRGEEHMCYLFEQAGRQVSMHQAGQWYATMPENELKQVLAKDHRLQEDWHPLYGDRMQKIVFIGIDMDIEDLNAKLQACLCD